MSDWKFQRVRSEAKQPYQTLSVCIAVAPVSDICPADPVWNSNRNGFGWKGGVIFIVLWSQRLGST